MTPATRSRSTVRSRSTEPLWPQTPLVRAVGRTLSAALEVHERQEEVDHVRFVMDAGPWGRIVVAVNTTSKRNRLAGFDPRVRVGIIRGHEPDPPATGVYALAAFDYAEVERSANVFFEHHTREALEERLLGNARRSFLLEAWGAPYRNRGPGIHQVHSRRASCAVPTDLVGRDGGLRFFFSGTQETETVLFKFCGQP